MRRNKKCHGDLKITMCWLFVLIGCFVIAFEIGRWIMSLLLLSIPTTYVAAHIAGLILTRKKNKGD